VTQPLPRQIVLCAGLDRTHGEGLVPPAGKRHHRRKAVAPRVATHPLETARTVLAQGQQHQVEVGAREPARQGGRRLRRQLGELGKGPGHRDVLAQPGSPAFVRLDEQQLQAG
jgi:hypothetical protein